MSSRRGINISAPCVSVQSAFEKKMYDKTLKKCLEIESKYLVGAYSLNENELPAVMEKYGFRDVSTHYIIINLTPDNSCCSKEFAYEIINANRQVDLDSVENLLNVAPKFVTNEDVKKLKQIKNDKYDKRIELYNAGIKQWDTNVCVLMVVRGVK